MQIREEDSWRARRKTPYDTIKKFISTLLGPGLGSYTFLAPPLPHLTYKFTSLSGHGVRNQRTVTVEFSIDRGEAGGVAHVGSSLASTWRNTDRRLSARYTRLNKSAASETQ